ncbi:Flagellar basal-body rod protein FlgG [Candidatus Competibacter denitrificans Run_A_D11]|jgi:flagellar basal-body rod protein FlgG|uniref:Flagellar basal-body rod protein FlgG n=1 Tax=Candidatus Competibacter denitrificans Run_A_D11 TaxID=1400863 RepID=W6M5C5_9GAMM|nr:flagellar basal-body rod protein FlgG [Candidatus Competibacter denitrificans]CDI02952.1 Flagellar basal-body rod protein FlgG [Candidatus Competibacter denitrificans Run_A_D11]HRC68629.1 flagellar basal-body rod protein FlgG [Candidatus Competibacter denitrificans]
MTSALWIAKTGLDAQQTRMSVISNNLSNASTTGFKQSRAQFEDLLYQNVRQTGGQSSQNTQLPSGLTLGTGVRIVSTAKIFTQGNLVQTGNNLDMAVNGRGFFQVQLPDGTAAYTRDGSFQINAEGQIVTANGYLLQPEITLPTNAQTVTIGSDGTVSAQIANQPTASQVGTLQLTDFVNPAGLQAVGGNLFLESAASGSPQTGTAGTNGMGQLVQGSLETSNVNVVEELVDMIETQRTYEMNSKAISSTDQMLQYVNNNL